MKASRALRILIVAGCCIVGLAAAGLNAESKLYQTSLSVSGTESARTEALVRQYFGESETFVILFKGPSSEVRAQGKQLVQALDQDPLATTISPWSREASRQLQPTRRSALILVSFRVGLDEAVRRTVPYVDGLLARHVHQPVQAVQSGYPSISRAIQEEAAQATRRGELIAIPLVLLVLLLVFRSPVAAVIPLAFGAATVAGSRGILSFAANWLSIDAFALTVSTMMGLAMGVDYTLLMVSRFREELSAGKSPSSAASATRRTAGRTIAFAGGALFLSMAISAMILPGTFLVSLAGAVVIVAGFSVALGVLVVPALLSLVGKGIDRWSMGAGQKDGGPMFRTIDRFLARPGLAAALLAVALVLLALPAISLRVGPPSLDQLASTNPARLNAELVNREVGPGWAGPYVILAVTSKGPITSERHLAALSQWERAVNGDSDVQAVIGPGAIAKRVKPLGRAGRIFLAQGRPGSQATELQQLGTHLERAAQGVARLRGGIARTTYGTDLLSEGSQKLEGGAQVVAMGLLTAAEGTGRTSKALGRFSAGTQKIRTGQHRAALGALGLKFDLQDLVPRLRHSTLLALQKLQQELAALQRDIPQVEGRSDEIDRQLEFALSEFQKISDVPDDPHYSSALTAVQSARSATAGVPSSTGGPEEIGNDGLSTELEGLGLALLKAAERADQARFGARGGVQGLHEAVDLATRLASGLSRLERGGQLLDSGADRLARSTSALARGLPRLSHGATALSHGTEEFALGTSSLASSLGQVYALSSPLEPGLRKAAARSALGGVSLRRESRRLRQLSPGIFKSGYFTLSALDGTPGDVRSTVEQAVNVNRGGQAARILVVPKHESAIGLDNRLRAAAPRLGRRIGGTAGVAGGRAELHDYSRASRFRLPIVIAVVSLVTFLSLVIILRAILAPALTVVLNLLSVAVSFGVLTLLARLPDGAPVGNWSHIDTIGAVAIFAVAFGVSIDYSVFILVRMREKFDQGVGHEAAVWGGVQRTGRVITGAALMMIAVFAAFATSSLAIVSQLGIGLTVAILVDATVIRLVLLPALLLLVGERCWWLPRPVGRLIGTLRLT